jgi:hypothetical protein
LDLGFLDFTISNVILSQFLKTEILHQEAEPLFFVPRLNLGTRSTKPFSFRPFALLPFCPSALEPSKSLFLVVSRSQVQPGNEVKGGSTSIAVLPFNPSSFNKKGCSKQP